MFHDLRTEHSQMTSSHRTTLPGCSPRQASLQLLAPQGAAAKPQLPAPRLISNPIFPRNQIHSQPCSATELRLTEDLWLGWLYKGRITNRNGLLTIEQWSAVQLLESHNPQAASVFCIHLFAFLYLAAYCWVFSFTIPSLKGYILFPSPKEAHKLQASAMTGTQVRLFLLRL